MIFQLTGYSDTGKTTLAAAWTSHLTDRGYVVCVIKHHGHKGVPLTTGDDGKDTARYRKAGAESSLVVSDSEFQWTGANPPPLKTLIHLVETTEPDVILIEGFKESDYPKAVLVRGTEDADLVRKSTNVKAVICPGKKEMDGLAKAGIEALPLEEKQQVIHSLTTLLIGDDTP
ncbi:molybdopterin-guanine dinucleotide biosynthesis protein B [Alteribacter lacisalsi]|uniref:Molybdopterin-guanine dinucleotide biosynthesis protein B n=1 Tax=Alteribacter lacisalsi TaxID=2045244 RepID=A0A2W0HIX3_9BACI|nr:molybdopterin-guanine dinucleotide biosynthesis protein B [Alteribacter lacisalsi]PYZ97435.1 molybdopterin-guanine dinucleotide biosynthesis protein B [Alteribacter lacisalsi]